MTKYLDKEERKIRDHLVEVIRVGTGVEAKINEGRNEIITHVVRQDNYSIVDIPQTISFDALRAAAKQACEANGYALEDEKLNERTRHATMNFIKAEARRYVQMDYTPSSKTLLVGTGRIERTRGR